MLQKAIKAIVDTLRGADNEATAAPYWLILDPRQNMSCDIHALACQISGPFFSREDAQNYLDAKKHHYSDRAKVYCHSGYFSQKYAAMCREIEI